MTDEIVHSFVKVYRKNLVDNLAFFQTQWLLSHNDIALEPETEQLVIGFINDTTRAFLKDYERMEKE